MITAWRIVKPEYAADAFSGDGAVENAGRWHSAGTRVVYVAESAALATLEIFVHMRKRRILPTYAIIRCSIPEAVVEAVDLSRLPANWYESPAPLELQKIGDEWARSRRSAALKIPAAVTQIEFNYVLNPTHEDFHRIEIGPPRTYRFDLRLF
ncbi:MAG TPA: RES family NAD+ phosphorylase [Thermoanaerobaculia bacterium]|nr:RES family NAD+ phosphorylase [Thermoanaerobaculia bacterium]